MTAEFASHYACDSFVGIFCTLRAPGLHDTTGRRPRSALSARQMTSRGAALLVSGSDWGGTGVQRGRPAPLAGGETHRPLTTPAAATRLCRHCLTQPAARAAAAACN